MISTQKNRDREENKMNEETDEKLALRVQSGEVDCFGELMRRYERRLLVYLAKFIRGEEVRDVVQEVFIKAYKNIQGFDANKRWSPWIYRIAHNEMVNNLKRKAREPLYFFDPEMMFPHPVATDNPQIESEKLETKKELDACLNDLDERYREVLALRFFEDMDYKDIADVLKIPVVTVGVRLKRGKERLKKIYEGKQNNK